MKSEESIDPAAQRRGGDRGSAGSNSPDQPDADSVAKASPGLDEPPVDPAEPLNPA